ncbi:MAG TPA: hypothetical protein VFS62_09310 [Chloroflexota bacterium]|jgi:hypothetical protein|nr:hypothetical protein [Chloroflexota bacterium]
MAGVDALKEGLIVTLVLSREQADILGGVLRDHVADLRMEIGKTDSYALRQELKRREQLLDAVVQQLPTHVTAA